MKCAGLCSVMSDSVAPWTVARQAPLPMEVSREEYWSGVQFPTQEIFRAKGLNPHLLHLLHWQVDSLPRVPPGKPSMKYSRSQKNGAFLKSFNAFVKTLIL